MSARALNLSAAPAETGGGVDWIEPASVAMSHGTAAVLRALSGSDSPFTVRELARVADLSSTRARQVVHHLIEHGLVVVDAAGGSYQVKLNRGHLAAEPAVALATLRSRTLERLRTEVTGWPVPALHVSLFGSAARGDGGTQADLDLLVVLEPSSDSEVWDEQFARSGELIQSWTGNPVGWFDVTIDELSQKVASNDPVIAEWQRDAINLAGPSLNTFLRKMT